MLTLTYEYIAIDSLKLPTDQHCFLCVLLVKNAWHLWRPSTFVVTPSQ